MLSPLRFHVIKVVIALLKTADISNDLLSHTLTIIYSNGDILPSSIPGLIKLIMSTTFTWKVAHPITRQRAFIDPRLTAGLLINFLTH